MARKGSGVPVPDVGATVSHPLWPELGTGVVETRGTFDRSEQASTVTGRVRWSTGQVSTHNLSVLREVE